MNREQMIDCLDTAICALKYHYIYDDIMEKILNNLEAVYDELMEEEREAKNESY